jgi:hypothetical protein
MKNDPEKPAAVLLKQVTDIWQKYDELNRKAGLKYNIFNIAQIENKELIICRVIADLLNPNGAHYKGSVYLKLFMDIVTPLVANSKKLDIAKAKVSTEYLTNKNRRIDIVIEDSSVFIPIEVKIYAGEQEKQIADYAAFSRKKNGGAGFIPVIFLTPDGRDPADGTEGDYISFSFREHIIPWLTNCLRLKETEKTPPIKEILKQLIAAVKLLYGSEDDEMENAINKLIAQSDESLKAALLIRQALENEELDFDHKTYDVFRTQVFSLVRQKISSAEYLEEDDWCYINIPFRKSYILNVTYNWKRIDVCYIGGKKSANDSEMEKIKKTMSALTGVPDEMDENFIWVSDNSRYPGLENTDDALYQYELYRIYSINAQAAAEKIVSMANALESL